MPKRRPTFRPAIRYTDPQSGKVVTKSGEQWYDVHATLFEGVKDKKLRAALIEQDAEFFAQMARGGTATTPAGFIDETGRFFSREEARKVVDFFDNVPK